MYSDSKKGKGNIDSVSQQNIISHNSKMVGDVISDGPFRIDGTVEGNLKTPGKVVVGKTGIINGTLEGTNADFEGTFSGKLILSGTLTLKASAVIEGEVVVGKLAVEPGATFNATCSMKGAVKELSGERKTEKSA
jgi:cytoskeletal protein CcmA (bactofilin family)